MYWISIILEILFLFALIYGAFRMAQRPFHIQTTYGYILFYLLCAPLLLLLAPYIFQLEYIPSNFLLFYLFAILIIFQHEFRVTLLRIGERLFGTRLKECGVETELLVAIPFLANRNIGALIAIELNVALDQYRVQGVMLDAKVTKELLWAIFWPGNPLHDGGVIIQDGKIAAASCVFPLSQKSLEPHLGMKHRAALGLSEVTDAFIIAVSEERGEISLCHKEKFYQNISLEELEIKLHQCFVSNDDLTESLVSQQRYPDDLIEDD